MPHGAAPDAPLIRDATADDAPACAELYAPFVRSTAITFETEPPDAAEMARRIAASQHRHAWLVAVRHGVVLGYAYGTEFRSRAAYRHTCETSIYLDSSARGSGTGRVLYGALLDRLRSLGFVTAVAGMTVPNPASDRLHRSLAFTDVGVFARVGFKFGQWRDVAWMQRPLHDGDPR